MSSEANSLLHRFGNFGDEVAPHSGRVEFVAKPLRTRLGLKRLSGPKLWFLLLVILPTIVSTIYFFTIASDLYMSEAEFVVRSAEKAHSSNMLDKVLQSTGSSGDQQTYVVKDYILSRDALSLLEKDDDIRAIFNRPLSDFLSRFPRPFSGKSFEHLFSAYKRFVDVTIDEDSGIATLRVKAFTPQDSHTVAESLIKYSEALINRMNLRSQQDLVTLAQREVDRTEVRVSEAQANMTAFRNRSMMIDPTASSGHMLSLVSRLAEDEALLKARLSELERSSPGSPQISVIRGQVQAIRSQIDTQNGAMAGNNQSMTPKLAQFEQLQLERDFADKELATALQFLSTARVDAEQQHLYLDLVSEPITPDYALYPKRLKAIALVFFGTLLTYAMGLLLTTAARDHIS